jgi:hypothetical protein
MLAAVVVSAAIAPGAVMASVRPAVSTLNYYVTINGSGTACSPSHRCALKEAVSKAVSEFGAPAAIHVGAGTFPANVCLFASIGTACSENQVPGFTSLTITGAGQYKTTIKAAKPGNVFSIGVDSSPVTLAGLGVTGGRATDGAGILLGGTTLTLDGVYVDNNSASASGGGITDDGGTLTIVNSTITANDVSALGGGQGGGVSVTTGGQVTISHSLIGFNSVTASAPNSIGAIGGGIAAVVTTASKPLRITDSTIWNNVASGNSQGAGVSLTGGSAQIVGSTIFGNQAGSGSGGGLYVTSSGARATLGGDLLWGNTAAASSTCGTASGGQVSDLGHTVADDSSCALAGTSKVVTDAQIGTPNLGSNGGLTRSPRIGPTSAAHDFVPTTAKFGTNTFCSDTDQRGVPRTQGPATHCDAGAYQFAPPRIVSESPNNGAPGTVVTVTGYGFYFCSLKFGTTVAGLSENTGVRISTIVPSVAPGATLLNIVNPDGSSALSFTVLKPLSVTTASLPNGSVGHVYSASLAATGGKAPYSWHIAGGTLPPGLALSGNGHIGGKPKSIGSHSFTVAVTDANHLTRTRVLSIKVT